MKKLFNKRIFWKIIKSLQSRKSKKFQGDNQFQLKAISRVSLTWERWFLTSKDFYKWCSISLFCLATTKVNCLFSCTLSWQKVVTRIIITIIVLIESERDDSDFTTRREREKNVKEKSPSHSKHVSGARPSTVKFNSISCHCIQHTFREELSLVFLGSKYWRWKGEMKK